MKIVKYTIPFLLFVIVMGFSFEPYSYNGYKPVFMLREELEKNVKLKGPKDVLNPGKIYIKDHLIFINEKYRGIHVIDNTNPEDPTNFAFISIDGCIDMAVKDDVLYADNAVDLIAIYLKNDMTDIQVTKRIRNLFPILVSPDGNSLNWKEERAKPDGAILVRWEEK